MPLFGRKPQSEVDWNTVPCTPRDVEEWLREFKLGNLSEVPNDGRYFVMLVIERNSQGCLVYERPATRHEAETLFRDFARDFRTRPKRINETHHDDLDGVWAAQRRGYPFATLVIVHPHFIEDVTYVAALRDEWESTEMQGSTAAPDDPASSFARDRSIVVPTHQAEVSVRRYGELLNIAMSQAATLFDAKPDELDRVQAVAQDVANHTPDLPLLQNLESSALSYLSAALWQARVEGMWNAALFGPSDPALRQRLAEEKDVAGLDEVAASEFLRDALRSIYMNARRVFDDLQLADDTLNGLYLDDITEDRAADRRTVSAALRASQSAGVEPGATCSLCGTVNPLDAKFCAERGSRLAVSSA